MHVVGMEVTQGVQTTGNTVPLVQGKRTFVRLYVKSDDSSRDVPKVTARLRATWTGGTGGGIGDWIDPTNVFAITVRRTPSRQNLDDAFLFELPWDWVSGDNLHADCRTEPGSQSRTIRQLHKQCGDGWAVPSESVATTGGSLVRIFVCDEQHRLRASLRGTIWQHRLDSPGLSGERNGWSSPSQPVAACTGPIPRCVTTALPIEFVIQPCHAKEDTTSSPDPKLPDCQNLRAAAYVQSQIAATRDAYKACRG